jgi:hypothetical protein
MALPEVTAAKAGLQDLARRLRAAGHESWAGDLERSLRTMDGWYDTKEMLFVVGGWLHPRAIGDLAVPGQTAAEWNRRVEQARVSCARAFHALERLPPGRRGEV